MASENTQKVLLTKATLTLEKAIEISQGMEAAAKQSKELKGAGGPPRSTPVLVVDAPTPVAKLCGRCGRGKHSPAECKFMSATCHKCGKVGHIAPACRSKKNFKSPQKAQWVDSSEPSTPTTASLEEPLYVINHHTSPPYRVQLQVQGTPLTMAPLVDTGAAVSLAPESAVAPFLTSSKLLPSTVVLKTYTRERIQVKGTLQVNVEYGQQQYTNLPLLVVAGSGPCLMGRDWLRVVRLDWRSIGKVSTVPTPVGVENQIAALQDKYQEVFSDTLGTIMPFRAKLSVKPTAQPKFFKPRSVPFALRERVESELDRLEQEGVLEKTHFSEWAAPIVVVPKPDGRLRLCGDYKVTINPMLDVDQYPLPRPDDIFASLAGGQQFSTLDLAHASLVPRPFFSNY